MSERTHAPLGDIIRRIEHIGWVETPSGCWEFPQRQRPGNGRGSYGVVSLWKRSYLVHRMMYAAYKGPIPSDQFVLHSCDNPPCCNPAHLRVGTPADNMRDMAERGRSTRRDDVCKRGHDRSDPANLYRQPNHPEGVVRYACRACQKFTNDHSRAQRNARRNAVRRARTAAARAVRQAA